MVGLEFDPNLTKTSAHSFILTLNDRGRVLVWDPNASMEADALGSGRPTTLRAAQFEGRIERFVYDVQLPGGKTQTRTFRFLYPIRTFIAPNVLPPRPR